MKPVPVKPPRPVLVELGLCVAAALVLYGAFALRWFLALPLVGVAIGVWVQRAYRGDE
jgi:hypothetical protein